MGREKDNNKKVGWQCDNDFHGDGTICSPICGPGMIFFTLKLASEINESLGPLLSEKLKSY